MNLASKPLVSILMTAYNRETYIREAITSVLKLDYPDWELIVVDDGSTDATVAIARKIAEKDPRIRVYVNEQNLGDYPNRNRAASYATGVYLQYLDSDDMIFEDSLSKIVTLAEQYPQTGLFMSSLEDRVAFIPAKDAISKHFFEKQFLYYGPGGTFIRRDFFNRIGGYPEKYGPANDMYFNLKAACNTDLVIHPYRLIFYRQHEGQESRAEYTYIIENFRYMRDALEELPLPFTPKKTNWLRKKNYRRFLINLFRYCLHHRDMGKLRSAWQQADFNYKYLLLGIFH